MSSIYHSIKTAIERANATTLQERNRIYLAARDAINRLPEDHSETAMAQLLEVVKDIEAEFARQELDVEVPLEAPAYSAKLPPEVASAPFDNDDDNQTNGPVHTIKSFAHRRHRLQFAALATGLVFLIGLSIYLLYFRYEKSTGENQATVTGTLEAVTPSGQELSNLFSYKTRADFAKLSSNSKRAVPLTSLDNDDPNDPAISLSKKANIYGANSFKMMPDKLYQMRFKLKVEPRDSNVRVNAGFSSIGDNPENPGKDKVFRNYFVHKGIIEQKNLSQNGNEYIFSGLTQWREVEDALKLEDNGGVVRPVIIVRFQSEETKVWLTELSLEEL